MQIGYNICVIKCSEKNAFTITEAIITMLIIGVVLCLAMAAIKLHNPRDKGERTLSWKMGENIESAALQILLNHASYDNFLRIKDGNGYFSIEDPNVTKRMADLFAKYLSDIDYRVDMNNEYFSKPILDYDESSTGEVLKSAYSNFFYVTDGMLIGFRFYQGCNSTENNANPPEHKGRYSLDKVCGSIFYDTNAFDKPNKLGSDQFILPVYERGIKYNND